jgi:hypothetical protein
MGFDLGGALLCFGGNVREISYYVGVSICFPIKPDSQDKKSSYLLSKSRLLNCCVLERDYGLFRKLLANLFSIVDLPDDGLPTRPINGSRGILNVVSIYSNTRRGLLRTVCRTGGSEKSWWDV